MKTIDPPVSTVRSGIAGIVASIVLAASSSTQAVTLSFDRVTSNSPTNYSSLLSATVTDLGTAALFLISLDDAPPSGDIRNIFFEDTGGIFSAIAFSPAFTPVNPTVVAFDAPSNPASPPGIGSFATMFSFEAHSPMPQVNAIDNGEGGAFVATYAGGFGSADVFQALNNGSLRVALHMQSLDPNEGESDSYLSEPTVPEPALALLTAVGLILLLRHRR